MWLLLKVIFQMLLLLKGMLQVLLVWRLLFKYWYFSCYCSSYHYFENYQIKWYYFEIINLNTIRVDFGILGVFSLLISNLSAVTTVICVVSFIVASLAVLHDIIVGICDLKLQLSLSWMLNLLLLWKMWFLWSLCLKVSIAYNITDAIILSVISSDIKNIIFNIYDIEGSSDY